MQFACRICVFEKGLRGSEIASLPKTEEELFDHMEREHHIVVRREGETAEQAEARVLAKYPEIQTCPECGRNRAAEGTARHGHD